MPEKLINKLRELLASAEGKQVTLKSLRDELRLEPGTSAWESIRWSMKLLEQQKVVKSSGLNDGVYRVLKPIEPISFSLDGTDQEGVLDVRFPRSYIDDTVFGIEDLVEISRGDCILITGETNYGKTAIALSILGENLGLFNESVLMGSEYTSSAGEISPKLKRRLRRMNWAKWIGDDSKPKFKLLPVEHDYEDYVEQGGLTVIDWISLPGEYYMIDRVMKTIKNGVGDGLVVPVVQKNKAAEFAEGGQRSERYADLVLKIDRFGEHESLLTIGKVKASKGKATGRMWAFEIVDYGANLANIREVVKCTKCWAKGYIRAGTENKRCPVCQGLKYVQK